MTPDRDAHSPFAECEHAFARCGLHVGVAESHGVLCGMLCARAEGAGEAWLDEIGAPPGGAHAASRDLHALLRATHEDTARRLASRDFDFRLMLPDDSRPLATRSAALGEWCQGFLYGLGIAGGAATRSLAPDAREVLEDLAELARIEPEPSTEEGESAYAELVEYVRVGVLLVREELRARERDAPRDATRH